MYTYWNEDEGLMLLYRVLTKRMNLSGGHRSHEKAKISSRTRSIYSTISSRFKQRGIEGKSTRKETDANA